MRESLLPVSESLAGVLGVPRVSASQAKSLNPKLCGRDVISLSLPGVVQHWFSSYLRH
ncbi:hypothetical protein PISMIDRAFT_671708 [Pisolithus microcarpus 441]|uniref:Uncharacterized protein n=1 Tax=Pisolithus microcarpus 441 TaxID=765257 RepID=A0A0D0A5P5_9AGAM|nr:hypothetical protein PISMIDRAFT_671708 [Pisolithus microcarpus 441]